MLRTFIISFICASLVRAAPLQVDNDLAAVIGNVIGAIGGGLDHDKPVSYIVPAIPNPNFKRDGHAALLKAYHKYSKHYSDLVIPPGLQNRSTLVERGTQTTSAAANSYGGDVLYLTPITIGGQTMIMDLDSGSSDLWVFSSQLSSSIQARHKALGGNIYTPGPTAMRSPWLSWNIMYADGSGAAGNVYFDTVTIGNISVNRQAVEAARAMSSAFVTGPSDGLMGLGFSKLNQVKPIRQKSFMENIMPLLKQQVFTADLRHNDQGAYEWGYINSTKFTGNVTYTKIRQSSGWWHFNASTGIQVNGVSFPDETGNVNGAVADTGSTLLLVSQSLAAKYYSQVDGSSYDSDSGSYVFPCSSTLPSLAVPVGNAFATIPGQYLSYGYADSTGNTCFGALQTLHGQTNVPFIYGDIFFKAQFAVFDYGNRQFGFAPKA